MRRYRPRFAGPEGAPAAFVPQFPMLRPWSSRTQHLGGHGEAAAGEQESYRVRSDRIVRLTIRLTEAELPTFDAWMEWWMANPGPIDFRFVHDDASTERSVRLHHPTMEEGDVDYQPTEQFGGGYTTDIEIRTADGQPFATKWRLRAAL